MRKSEAIITTENFEKIMWRTASSPVNYPDALAEMAAHQARMQAGTAQELIWLLEHPRLYTSGTSARAQDLFNPDALPVYAAGRGGQWTYHGPGQRIAYLMLDLSRPHGDTPPRDLRRFVADLEKWIIATLGTFGIVADVRPGRIGVWTTDPLTGEEAKIAAIGLRVSRWLTTHGVSINLAPRLEDFSGIVPCGIRDYGVTSIQRFKPDVTMAALDSAMKASWHDIFRQAPQNVP